MFQVDPSQKEFLKEMMEVEKEMNQAAAQVRGLESEIFSLRRNIKKNELTVKELDNIKDLKSVFIPLGKAFVSKPQDLVKKEFSSINQKYEQDIKECEKSKAYFDEKRKEKEKIVKDGLERIMKK